MTKFKSKKLLKDQFNIKNQNVVIVGGGGFLSLYFAEAICEYGGIPILVDVERSRIISNCKKLNRKYKCLYYFCDLSDPKLIKSVFQKIIKENKKISTLINAANYKIDDKKFYDKFENYDLSIWNSSLEINLTANFIISQIICKHMSKFKNGSIINISSDVGVISPDHRIYKKNKKNNYKGVEFNTPIAYSASKSALLSMTRYLATYWAKKGIRVNSISPAGVKNNQPKKFVNELENLIPLNRMMDPNELKGAILFLSSDASSFVTGSNLIIDGGRTIW